MSDCQLSQSNLGDGLGRYSGHACYFAAQVNGKPGLQ